MASRHCPWPGVCVAVDDTVGVAVDVAVAVGIFVDVDVAVGVAVDVDVAVGIIVDVAVAVGTFVDVDVAVGVAVDVDVAAGTDVEVDVGVRDGAGVVAFGAGSTGTSETRSKKNDSPGLSVSANQMRNRPSFTVDVNPVVVKSTVNVCHSDVRSRL